MVSTSFTDLITLISLRPSLLRLLLCLCCGALLSACSTASKNPNQTQDEPNPSTAIIEQPQVKTTIANKPKATVRTPKATAKPAAQPTLSTTIRKVVKRTTATTKRILVPETLWSRMRQGFGLPYLDSERVRHYERRFTAKPEYITRIFKRASWFLPSILSEVEKRGYPSEIALLPAVESAFMTDAKSHSGASGLWQFIASTGRIYDMHNNDWYDARRDPDLSTQAAMQFLGELNTRFNGDWFLSLAGYNAGGGNIEKAMRNNISRGLPTDYSSLKLRKETTDYVPKLIAFKNIVNNPEAYGVSLPKMPNRQMLQNIDAGSQINLKLLASAIDMNSKTLLFLNSAYKHGVTPPEGPHRIQVPIEKVAMAKQVMATLTPQKQMHWAQYTVKRGDVLNRISQKHKVSVNAIRQANRISGHAIHPGQVLRIPLSSQSVAMVQHNTTKTKAQNKKITHQVRKGESLWQIAQRYGVKVAQITRWNNIRAQGTLRLGQKLIIYTAT